MTTHDTSVREGDTLDHTALLGALDAIRDYRGDVTLECVDGSTVAGFVFDVIVGEDLDASSLRLLVPGDSAQRTIAARAVRAVRVSGRDAAAGKTWENWVRRYAAKRSAGEAASIESESLA